MSGDLNVSNHDPDNNIVNDSLEEELPDLVAASTKSREPAEPSFHGPDTNLNKSKEKLLDESVEKSINTKDNTIRPRSQCDGGTKQLKLNNQTKGPALNCIVKERALARINQKVGEAKSAELKARWNEIQHKKQKSKK